MTGALTYAQIMGVWIDGGGAPQVASIMAAIAEKESSGQPGIVQQGQPYKTTGWGLWQITPGNSVPSVGVDNALLDPVTNARAAVVKYKSQGLRAWTTYNNGSYRTVYNPNATPDMTGYAGAAAGAANATNTNFVEDITGVTAIESEIKHGLDVILNWGTYIGLTVLAIAALSVGLILMFHRQAAQAGATIGKVAGTLGMFAA